MVLVVAGCGRADAPADEPDAGAADAAQPPAGDVHLVQVPLDPLPEGASLTFPMVDPRTGDLWFSVFTGSFDDQTIWVSRAGADGFQPPETASFSGRWGDRAPRFAPDGSYLLITSNRPPPGVDGAMDMNVWRVDRDATGWGDPDILPEPVNSPDSDIHPSVTDQATWLASARMGGLGRSDLYRIGADAGIEHLGPPLNDELSQPDLWVSPDETWMVLAITDHPDGEGGDDLYVSHRTEDGWSTPRSLGPQVNTPEYEYGPSVSPDGRWLYFTSHRDGPGRIYRVALDLVPGIPAGRDG